MRYLSRAVLASLALFVAACGSDDDGGDDGAGGADSSSGGESGAEPSTGGRPGSARVEFSDLPGKIRFANFVSDGSSGINLDLYWGVSIARSEPVATIEYGEVTEFITPRRANEIVLDANEARFFLVPEGDVSGNPTTFLVQDDPKFSEETALTIAMAAADNALAADFAVSVTTIHEDELSTPPAGMAHVFGWSNAFAHIEDGDFVLVGAEGLCDPERGDSGGANLGAPALIPDGSTGLSLFDANTEPPCDTGASPVDESVEGGHTYVLLGEAKTYDIDARRAVLLELGTAN